MESRYTETVGAKGGAMILNITESEAEILRMLLQAFLEETRSELHHTDTPTYKDKLRGREQAATDLLLKLSEKPSPV